MRKVRSIKKWTDDYEKVANAVEDLLVLDEFSLESTPPPQLVCQLKTWSFATQ